MGGCTSSGLEDKVAALMMARALRAGRGWAIADVLTGRAEPQGRLVVSVPKSAGAMPYYYNHKLKAAARHSRSTLAPLSLGFGLGWTQFNWAQHASRKTAYRWTARLC